jgi:hypothetical protein
MSDNKMEELECFYCYKGFRSEFLRREHISYGHRGLIEFQSSKIYHNLLKEMKGMKTEIEKLKCEIEEMKKNKMN